jgi:hypothetical protein
VGGLVAVMVFAPSFLGVQGMELHFLGVDLSLGDSQGRCSRAQSTATPVMPAHNGVVNSAPRSAWTSYPYACHMRVNLCAISPHSALDDWPRFSHNRLSVVDVVCDIADVLMLSTHTMTVRGRGATMLM